MDHAALGGTGIRVSRFCLGAMMFGAWGNPDRRECLRIIHRALDAGINFLDTADTYSAGGSEEIVGEALRGRRDRVVVATKFFGPMGEDVNERGASRRWIVREVEQSLRRLATDHIDLYQLHRFAEDTDLEETLGALTDLVRQGKIRAFGGSMFPAHRIVEAHWTSERRGLLRLRCEQAAYSIFAREIELAVLPTCARTGMGAITYGPLNGGWLSGRYRSPDDFTGESRVVRFAPLRRERFDPKSETSRRRLALVAELSALAEEAGLDLPRLAIAFAGEHPAVTSVILGPRTFEQLESALGAAQLRLDPAVLDRIDELAPPGTNVAGLDTSSLPSSLQAAQRRRPPRSR